MLIACSLMSAEGKGMRPGPRNLLAAGELRAPSSAGDGAGLTGGRSPAGHCLPSELRVGAELIVRESGPWAQSRAEPAVGTRLRAGRWVLALHIRVWTKVAQDSHSL